MKFNRRQILLGGLGVGITATTAKDYQIKQQQKQLQALAKQQIPQDQQSLLKAAFQADAERIYEGQKIVDALNLSPPKISYNREMSKLLIQCSKIATQQYLTGKTISDYDGSIKTLPAYNKKLDRYEQIASFQGKETQISEKVAVNLPNDSLGNFSDPLEQQFNTTEDQVEQAIQEIVTLSKEIPVYFGFVLSSPENNIIIFRGTQTRIEWINNFTALQKDYTDPISGQYFGKIHQGFIKNYLRIVAPMPKSIAQKLDPTIPCYITGHSLGASLAILAALDIAINTPQLKNKIQLYTYASPRVGDPTFAKLHAQYIPNSYRVVNLADIIAFMPPTQSVGTYVDVGQEWSFLSHQNDFMPNHVVDTYLAAIERGVETNRDRQYPISGLT
ncbi:MAG TPA: lipase [Cyanothece sp. UBA12306]|nr:lipase [Cyanothece sp. UBA12306]